LIQVLLADDRPVVLEGLKRILAECPDVSVVGCATNRQELLTTLRTTETDVLLLDISLAGLGTFGLLRQLDKEHPTTRAVVLGVDGEGPDAERALDTGAAGYLTRDHSPGELVAAIRTVVRGAEYMSSTLVQRFVTSRRAASERPRYEALSNREYQVLCMFGSGRAFGDIAAELGISRKTVSTYRRRILQKLRLITNADLIRYVVQNRLVV
jgi:two-component system invasion response regulator UvrY